MVATIVVSIYFSLASFESHVMQYSYRHRCAILTVCRYFSYICFHAMAVYGVGALISVTRYSFDAFSVGFLSLTL